MEEIVARFLPFGRSPSGKRTKDHRDIDNGLSFG
jgi:hypothetical protein